MIGFVAEFFAQFVFLADDAFVGDLREGGDLFVGEVEADEGAEVGVFFGELGVGFLELLEEVGVEGGELEFELLPVVFLFDLARPFFAKAVNFRGVF